MGIVMKNRSIKSVTSSAGTAAFGCPVERCSTTLQFEGQAPASDGVTPPARALQIIRRLAERLQSFPKILAATLREIFDEAAYARFLKQRQLISSRAAYAAFRQEYEAIKARRPRCC